MVRVLVALDESEASERVTDFVESAIAALDVEIVAVSVARGPVAWIPPPVGYGFAYGWWDYGERSVIRREAAEANQAVAERVVEESGAFADDAVVARGDPATVILDTARKRDVDMIIVGSNHKGLLQRILDPSVSKEVLREAARPVTVVP